MRCNRSLYTLTPLIPEGKSFHEALNFALVFCVWSDSGYGGLAYASEEIVNPEHNDPRSRYSIRHPAK